MEYHAAIEKSEGWWIGWLVDLPGVNAQERTQEELLESLKAGAEDMLDLKGIHEPTVEIVVPPAAVAAGSRVRPSKGMAAQVIEQLKEAKAKD
ncbi:MAG: type II toxin-antitoxin system HicB family antitoxin [Desulfomonilaceae bacterium]